MSNHSSDFASKINNLIEIYNRAKTFGTNPAALLGISHPMVAYCFDRAVWHLNTTMEADIQEHSKKAKGKNGAERAANRRTQLWLKDGTTPQKFADPMAMGMVRPKRGGQ